jgi:uncharacterized protein (TIGR03067 family)
MIKEETLKKEIEKFQGNWIQIAYERSGLKEPIDDEEGWKPRTIFKDNSFVVKISDGTIPIKGIFKIDPSKEPKHIEYTDTFGQYAGETYLGIYYFDEDILVFCVADHLEERPQVFKTGHGQVMRTFQRELDSTENLEIG